MTDDNLSHDPDFKAWAADVHDNLLPKLKASAITVSLAPNGETDIKYAVELGLSIMLDKPIIVVAEKGQELPSRLQRVADRVIYADFRTEAGRAEVARALKEITAALH